MNNFILRFKSTILLTLRATLLIASSVSAETFLFVAGESAQQTCPNDSGPNCFFGRSSSTPQEQATTAGAATKFVQKAKDGLHATTMLVSAGLRHESVLTQLTPLTSAAQTVGLTIYVEEKWAFRAASASGIFDCNQYITTHVQPNLLPLKQQFPTTLTGVAYDEPDGADLTNLALFARCWRTVIPVQMPALAGMKIFVDLVPTYADLSRLKVPSGIEDNTTGACNDLYPLTGGSSFPSQLADFPETYNYLSTYCRYAHSFARAVTPDYLALNSYLTDQGAWAASGYPGNTTTTLRDFMLVENHKIIGKAARDASLSRTIRPTTYMQNYGEINKVTMQAKVRVADFNSIRWHSGIGYAYGFRDRAAFLSHSFCGKGPSSACESWVSGFLNDLNEEDLRTYGVAEPNNPWSEFMSMRGVVDAASAQLASFQFVGTVFPHQGVFVGPGTGHALGWLPSGNLIAGEYRNAATDQNIIIFANRNYNLSIPSQIASFNYWVQKVEKFDFFYGIWVQQNVTSTNQVTFSETSFPFSMIRLTR